METLTLFIKRNVKLFFRDKGLFFVSLITPLILLVLFITFLGNVYEDSFRAIITAAAPDLNLDGRFYRGLVGGQLTSSLLSVCCITVAFCSNMVMVQDKAGGTAKDFKITPVKPYILALGYYIATFINTLIVAAVATACCCVYLATVGWFLTVSDVLFICVDVVILVLFGTALSTVINFFLSTQAQISAVGSIVSSMYGFICGAYMPMSQFPDWLAYILLFSPGTYGTVVLRRHCMQSVLNAIGNAGAGSTVIESIKDGFDMNVVFPGATQPISFTAIYFLFACVILLLIIAYILLIKYAKNKN